MKALRKMQTGNRELDQLQSNVAEAMNPILKSPIVDGVLLTSVDVSTTQFRLSHNLNRPYQGYIVVRKIGTNLDLYETTTQPDKSKYIQLVGSVNTTADIWVF